MKVILTNNNKLKIGIIKMILEEEISFPIIKNI
jgi:hypothetical protein